MTTLRIGIVGSAGQVGSAVLKGLNNYHGEFAAVGICRNRISAARVAAQGMPVRIVRTDNPADLGDACRDLDALVNCALPQYATSATAASNRRLAKSLAIACEGKQLVHLSSVAVYGDFIASSKPLFGQPKPDTLYGRQKLQMEHLLPRLAKKNRVKCTILRVGHVYGPELRWSETIFDLVKTDNFRLPFDGQIPSNTIAITNVIAGIRQVLIGGAEKMTVNLIDNPQTTWREVFDLHSRACYCPPATPINLLESEQIAQIAKRKSHAGLATRLVRETATWAAHLPTSYIKSVPAFKSMLQRVIAMIGSERLDAMLWAFYWRHFAPRLTAGSGPAVLPLFSSEPVPGACLSYEGTSPQGILATLRDWHETISRQSVDLQGRSVHSRGIVARPL